MTAYRRHTFAADQRLLTVAGSTGLLTVTAIAPDIVRIRLAKTAAAPRASWAVIQQEFPGTTADVAESAEAVTLTTDRLRVTVRKADLTVAVSTADGTPVVSDAAPAEFREKCVQAHKQLGADTRIYGLGQRMGFLNQRGEVATQWATDDPLHHPGRDAMYQAIPFYIAAQGAASYGLLLDSPAYSQFDLGKANPEVLTFRTETDDLDYYLIAAPSLKAIVQRYTDLTGKMPLPPKWALGFQQSRWSYFPESRVREIAETMRAKQIPCDVIYLDIDYMDGYRVFTWDNERFPDPAQLLADFAAMGLKVVTIIDPGVKQDPGYRVYDEGAAGGHFATNPDGSIYIGAVWPGDSAFPDFLQAKTRTWWGQQHKALLDQGVAGIWNDMNEPANFKETSRGRTVPPDVLQGEEGDKQPHEQVHNLYGQSMAAATVEGLTTLRPDERYFLLTRSGYAGIQRYAAVWMGDNHSWWEHLLQAMPTCLNMGLSGVPFVGTDAGGFSDDATPELLVRWTQMGAFTPFFRNHSAWGTRNQEPWAFDEQTEALTRDAIELRYRFLPYVYTAFEAASRTGLPIMRPLVLEYEDDPNVANLSDQYLFGPDVLVAPVYQPGAAARMVYLPRGNWVDFWTSQVLEGGRFVVVETPLERFPLFVRSTAILPLGPVIQHTGEAVTEVLFDVFGTGRGELYEDDGQTTAYRQGAFARTTVTSAVDPGRTTVTVGAAAGDYQPQRTRAIFRLRNHGAPKAASAGGQPATWELDGPDLLVQVDVPAGNQPLTLTVTY